MNENLHTIREQVEFLLKTEPDCRNSDKLLFWRVGVKFYGLDGKITLNQWLYELLSYESCRRWRQHFQEKGLYLPTELKVAVERRLNISKWREALGYLF